MDTSLVHKLLIEYNSKRQKALLDAENRKYELYKKHPEIEELDLKINKLSISSVKNILFSSPEKKNEELKKLQAETDKLINEKKLL